MTLSPPLGPPRSAAPNLASREIDLVAMNSIWWYHKIDLGGGIITPGLNFDSVWNPISSFLDGVDLAGKRVLDIGCWDGKWTFEAERRGAAQVVATDDVSQRPADAKVRLFPDQKLYDSGEEGFRFAHAALDSRAVYLPHQSVYDIDLLDQAPFDVVLFMGVFYHLRYPLYALSKVRRVVKEGGLLIMETAGLNDRLRPFTFFQFSNEQMIYYQDPTTWCIPTVRCVQDLLGASYFDVERLSPFLTQQKSGWRGRVRQAFGRGFASDLGRILFQARAVNRAYDKNYWPDPLLAGQDPRFQ